MGVGGGAQTYTAMNITHAHQSCLHAYLICILGVKSITLTSNVTDPCLRGFAIVDDCVDLYYIQALCE